MKRLTSIILATCLVAMLIGIAPAADIVIRPADTQSQAQAKINAYRPGDRVLFDGDRLVSAVFTVPNNGGSVTFNATPGTTLLAQHHSYILYGKGVNNVTVASIDFEGGGVYMENVAGWNVHHNQVHDIRNNAGNAANGIWFIDMRDSKVEDNTLYNMIGPGVDTGIFGYYPKRSSVSYNHFLNVHEGIHVWFNDSAAAPGFNKFVGNEHKGTERHDEEYQGSGWELLIDRNHVSARQPGKNGMAYSVANGDGGRTMVTNNVADFGTDPLPWSQNAGVEAMAGITVAGNYFRNTGQGIMHSQNVPGWIARDNLFNHVEVMISGGSGSPVIAPVSINNNTTTALPPTYQQLIAGTPPTTQPLPDPIALNFKLAAQQATDTHVQFILTGLPPGVAMVQAVGISTDGREPQGARAIPSDGITGPYPTNWKIDFYAEALDRQGRIIGRSNTVTIQVKKPDVPTTQPAPPPPPPQPSETIIKGLPWDLVFPVAPDGKVGQPTTRRAA